MTEPSQGTEGTEGTGGLLVLQFQDDCPPALLGGWLAEAGLTARVVRPDLGQPVPSLDAPVDAVLVLGGSMGAHDDAEHPWLGEVKSLLAAAVAAGVPTLGLCLGHQLLAAALGGRVARNPRGKTAGLTPVGWREEAADDVLLGALARSGVPARVVHWNDDVVEELPTGAVVLATTGGGEPQIVRYAAGAWGIQAHPEVDAAGVLPWTVRVDLPDVAERIAALDAARAELDTTWQPVAATFAALVPTRSPAAGEAS